MAKANKKMSMRARVGEGVVEALTQYDFPGNIRELENMVEQAVALSGGALITVDDLLPAPAQPQRTTPGGARSPTSSTPPSGRRSRSPCASTTAAREKAAEALAISATTLWRKMTRLGITYPV